MRILSLPEPLSRARAQRFTSRPIRPPSGAGEAAARATHSRVSETQQREAACGGHGGWAESDCSGDGTSVTSRRHDSRHVTSWRHDSRHVTSWRHDSRHVTSRRHDSRHVTSRRHDSRHVTAPGGVTDWHTSPTVTCASRPLGKTRQIQRRTASKHAGLASAQQEATDSQSRAHEAGSESGRTQRLARDGVSHPALTAPVSAVPSVFPTRSDPSKPSLPSTRDRTPPSALILEPKTRLTESHPCIGA